VITTLELIAIGAVLLGFVAVAIGYLSLGCQITGEIENLRA
jgi:hypothetical protein